ncbi:MAG: hypothetical protein CMF11_09700 [Idiomarina sp.]|nr:hypothetical protein [Idiomarina sp.]
METAEQNTPYIMPIDLKNNIDRLTSRLDDLEKSDVHSALRFRKERWDELLERLETTDKLLSQVWSKKREIEAAIEEISDLYQRVDELHQAQYEANKRIDDLQKSTTLSYSLISDKLGIQKGETSD